VSLYAADYAAGASPYCPHAHAAPPMLAGVLLPKRRLHLVETTGNKREE